VVDVEFLAARLRRRLPGCLTGLDNIRFIARIYGRPVERTTELVERFAALGQQLPSRAVLFIRHEARLAFGLSLAIEFDCYLIDEVFAVAMRCSATSASASCSANGATGPSSSPP